MKRERPEDGHRWEPSKNRPYFVYDPEGDGFSYFATEVERDVYASDCIQHYLDDCWSEEVVNVVAGVLTHTTAKCDVVKRPPDSELNEDGEDEDGYHWSDYEERCNYKLTPLT